MYDLGDRQRWEGGIVGGTGGKGGSKQIFPMLGSLLLNAIAGQIFEKMQLEHLLQLGTEEYFM